MIAKYNRKSLALGIPGLLLQTGCYIAVNIITKNSKAGGTTPPVSQVLLFSAGTVVGAVLLIIGLGYYAKAKGYSGALGLLGLLSCIGLLILAVLPDKMKGREDAAD